MYMAAAAAGDGPDILLSNSSNLWNLVDSGTALGLNDAFDNNNHGGFRDYAIQALTVDGTLYGLPTSVEAVALYYNRSLVSNAPTSTDALLDLVKQGKGLDIPDSPAYFAYGFWSAFGGQLMDTNGRCIADQGGFDLAVQYLLDLQDAGANAHADYGEASDRFRNGETAMTINGPWALPDYESALGADLGVVLLPSGPAGPARPLIGLRVFYVNPYSDNAETAVELALYLTNRTSAQVFADQANYIPVRNDVHISDSKIVTFSLAGTLGTPFPPNQWMSGYWDAFSNLFYDVLDNGVSPDDAVQRACEAMNQANGK
jgi:arabinogalactan oligomer/maltooligosaccharide transport system substrate-binding protein